MAKDGDERGRAENRLLAALPQDEYQRVLSVLEPINLDFKSRVYAPNEPISHVYFPRSGIVSLLAVLQDGGSAEVASVDHEGIVGLTVLFGVNTIPFLAQTRVPGAAVRMKAEVFREQVDRSESFRNLVERYATALFMQVAQVSACNSLHPLVQRLARWLLLIHRRTGVDQFPVTHEDLSLVLGVRRPTVTIALRMLRETGLIRYRRNEIVVVNQPGLESVTCECYQIIANEYDRLLG